MSGLLSANLNVVKMMCIFWHALTVNTEAIHALRNRFNSGQVGYGVYLIIMLAFQRGLASKSLD